MKSKETTVREERLKAKAAGLAKEYKISQKAAYAIICEGAAIALEVRLGFE